MIHQNMFIGNYFIGCNGAGTSIHLVLSNNKSWTGAWQSKFKMHSFERRFQTDIPLDVPQAWRYKMRIKKSVKRAESKESTQVISNKILNLYKFKAF
jgi:hypothetical protein